MTHFGTSVELLRERRDLAKADKDIVEGSGRIVAQHSLIAKMVSQGHDTGQARALLVNFEHMQGAWEEHRRLIAQRIALLEHR